MKQLSYVACLLVAGLLASCSKDNDSLAISNEKNLVSASAENNSGNTVHITRTGFTPMQLNVIAGSNVTWVNDDQSAHTVTSNDGKFNSGDIAPGASFTFQFTTIADHNYHCAHHPGEKGLIDVKGIK